MLTIITEKPSAFPISTAAIVSYVRAPSEDEALVKRLVARAFAAFAKFTNGHIAAPTTYEIWYDLNDITIGAIKFPVRPLLTAVDTITAYDDDNAETELDVFSFRGDNVFHILDDVPAETRDSRSLMLTGVFGYSDETIPDDILLGIEQYVVHAYERRGDQDVDIPDAVARLWTPYVRYQLGG